MTSSPLVSAALEQLLDIDDATDDAAAATMRHTGARLQAPTEDVDLVLAVLFSEVQS